MRGKCPRLYGILRTTLRPLTNRYGTLVQRDLESLLPKYSQGISRTLKRQGKISTLKQRDTTLTCLESHCNNETTRQADNCMRNSTKDEWDKSMTKMQRTIGALSLCTETIARDIIRIPDNKKLRRKVAVRK